MGPPSYTRSVVERNVVMRRMTIGVLMNITTVGVLQRKEVYLGTFGSP